MGESKLHERYDRLSKEYDRKYPHGSKISTARVNAIKQLLEMDAELKEIEQGCR